ncbi:histidine phosphatase [Leishmania donovani]|uniref:Histidine_phosphatase_superfamily_(Branch_1)_-__p utative n=3 Tax=Leishmania donovani species complex TaxID=38574 RepID=A0A6L0WK31_LEIIN|nr:hypothetical protein, unknown function [Leishmania infantum JPCM5]TPP42877.1 Histidine phosphatase (branch 1) family protein [Leishmania donovani]CAC9453993.1 Histidine_phosphatase_superfamily_(branch_1)_-__putative [Leishmania infantum]CAJ1986568.1 histidine phosphatase [Leishmania donovani]CAM65883.1 hypothetical protein, unknown function [Leishmania infantum JPCM5]SUZ39510.1 Histidine_phosphatase_superfamily_(branch_1)_-__putative [Leishmania infantum]|eukprot:XP_001463518.1 hypothetical protein, unknown function [Leishmania infantum JPCM5]
MPPAHIFIARHSERVDHMNREFAKTYSRPHDSPITENGVVLAEKLGEYLVRHYRVDPADVVVITSPLLRCVQTSNAIVTGALRAAAASAKVDTIPVYLEPAIMEGPYWMFVDMCNNPSVVEPNGGPFHCPEPVYNDAAFHRASTSPHVQLQNPFPLHPPPVFTVKDNKLVDSSFPERCAQASKRLLAVPELDGKTVVLVAHGETVLRALHAMKNTEIDAEFHSPPYTGLVHVTCECSGAETRVSVEYEPFATPHLPAEPMES